MQSIHYSHTMLADELFNECSFVIEFVGGSYSIINIEPSTYNDIYEVVAAINTEIAGAITGGSAYVADGMVVMQSSIPFRPVIHTQSNSVLRYDPLLLLMGFESQRSFSTFHKADTQSRLSFFKDTFNEFKLESCRHTVHAARGMHGKSKSVGLSLSKIHSMKIQYLNKDEFQHLKNWYDTAIRGRKIRYFVDDDNFLDLHLGDRSLDGGISVFNPVANTNSYWSANFQFVEV